MKQIPNLKALKLKSTDYKLLNEYLPELDYFEKIDISACYFQEIPSKILEMKNLKVLNLSKNKLKIIPDEIKNLSNLTKLDLRQNSLSNEEKDKLKMLLPDC